MTTQLIARDAIGVHAREELGVSEITPLLVLIYAVTISTLVFLAVLGALWAKTGGADVIKATVRVTFWGAVAMAVTASVGMFFGAVV